MARKYGIVDVFAGPGGLGEGFSAAGAECDIRFETLLSIEKQPIEVQTLRLRAFLRQFGDCYPPAYYEFLRNDDTMPDWSELFPREWAHAAQEARQLELGTDESFEKIACILDGARERFHGDTILIGGPPCQAYSLAGRARNKGKAGYVPEEDQRHFLYREYVRILDRLRPVAFVMENVKGMISSQVDGGPIFQRVTEDLSSAGDGYRLLSLTKDDPRDTPGAGDFLLFAEEHGVPQSRHRVFVVGLRNDVTLPQSSGSLLQRSEDRVTVRQTHSDLPSLRSGLSSGDCAAAWRSNVLEQAEIVRAADDVCEQIGNRIIELLSDGLAVDTHRSRRTKCQTSPDVPDELRKWLVDDTLDCLLQHETRTHRADDLGRYLFASVWAEQRGVSPRLRSFPEAIQPQHRSRHSGSFLDRFRVQVANEPSTTVVSHISKDGHYYIHPDPRQVRSMTVREAARLQTFPDNYFFCGTRTAQYHQVGNAVPPYLALQIARAIRKLLNGD